MLDMYQNHVLHGGPFDGYQIRARAGTLVVHVVDPGGPAKGGPLEAYRRRTIRDNGPFGRNEYHWIDPALIGDDSD